MSRKNILLILLVAPAMTASAAIDFYPALKEFVGEGIIYHQLQFKDNDRTVALELPPHWTYRGSADRLQLMPPNLNFAEGLIRAAPPTEPTPSEPAPFDEATVENLEQQVIADLPFDSQFVTVLKRTDNPIPFHLNPNFEFVVSYQALGLIFQRSVLFVNCPDKQLIFRFTAPKGEFEALNKVFRRVILSW